MSDDDEDSLRFYKGDDHPIFDIFDEVAKANGKSVVIYDKCHHDKVNKAKVDSAQLQACYPWLRKLYRLQNNLGFTKNTMQDVFKKILSS